MSIKPLKTEIARMAIGFFFSTVLVSGITRFYTFLDEKREHRKTELQYSTSLLYDMVDTCAKRHYHAYRLTVAIENNLSQEEIESRWKQYDQMIVYWNETRLRNLAMLRRYYGTKMELFLEQTVLREMGEIHTDLFAWRTTGVLNPDTRRKLHELEIDMTEFSDRMQMQLKDMEHNQSFF